MSRPQKMHKPIKGAFNDILAAVAMGTRKDKISQAKSKVIAKRIRKTKTAVRIG